MAGEREEMALVGTLTLQMLAHDYLDAFTGKAEEARRRLDAVPTHVLEESIDDQSTAANAA